MAQKRLEQTGTGRVGLGASVDSLSRRTRNCTNGVGLFCSIDGALARAQRAKRELNARPNRFSVAPTSRTTAL